MMKTIRNVCCVASCAAVLLGGVQIPERAIAANGWVKVITDARNKTWYVDSGSIQGRGRFRYFWSYTTEDLPFNEDGKLVYSSAFYLSVDCQLKRYRLRHAKSLDQNSNVVKEYSFGDDRPLAAVRSGSGEEASLNFVCSRR